jgi:YebC/PmpR family DNA-binding regulatory protein
MSGHSKWATTKRQKAVVDAKRSSAFTKIANVITIAARKGGDPEMNFSLRMAIDRAREVNMPKDNIERAIKRGTGELGGAALEELVYEGFGPVKAGFIIEVLTDNKNRTAADIKHLFLKSGGALGASGSVSWNFEHKGVVRIAKKNLAGFNWDELELELIDNGADDIKQEEEGVIIFTKIENLNKVKSLLDKKKVASESAAIEYVPKEEKTASEEDKIKIEKFIEELEENEDVSNYYTDVAI